MNVKQRRILSVLMVLAMLITMLPSTAVTVKAAGVQTMSVDLAATLGLYGENNFTVTEDGITMTATGGLVFELPEAITAEERVAITISGTLPGTQVNRMYLVPASMVDTNNQEEGVFQDQSASLPNTWTVTAIEGTKHFNYKGPQGGALEAGTVVTGIVVEYLDRPLSSYAITVSDDGNGTGEATPNPAEEGETVSLTATPDEGYLFKEWQVLKPEEGITIENDEFVMPAETVEVKAIFETEAEPIESLNYAASANGGSITIKDGNGGGIGDVLNVIDGDRTGRAANDSDGRWRTNTYPATAEITFADTISLENIVVVGQQKNDDKNGDLFGEPTEVQTTDLGLGELVIYAWIEDDWEEIGRQAESDLVIRKLELDTPIVTDKIRVDVIEAAMGWARLIEIEAWGRIPSVGTAIELIRNGDFTDGITNWGGHWGGPENLSVKEDPEVGNYLEMDKLAEPQRNTSYMIRQDTTTDIDFKVGDTLIYSYKVRSGNPDNAQYSRFNIIYNKGDGFPDENIREEYAYYSRTFVSLSEVKDEWITISGTYEIELDTNQFRFGINEDRYELQGNNVHVADVSVLYVPASAATPVTGVTLNSETFSLAAGRKKTLTATVAPENAADKTVTWSSDNTDVATVNGSGVVTAVSIGTATIKATSNADSTKYAECTVTVTEASDELMNYALAENGSSITIKDAAGGDGEGGDGNWPNVIDGDRTGGSGSQRWRTDQLPATAEITFDGFVSVEEVLIIAQQRDDAKVDGVYLEPTGDMTTNLGLTTLKLSAWNGSEWVLIGEQESSDLVIRRFEPETSFVTDKIQVVASSANGWVRFIEIEAWGTPAEIVPVTGMNLTPKTLALDAGGTASLTATFTPENATNKNVKWDTSDPSVAMVNNGVVTAVAGGTATITATSVDNETKKDTCIVTVTNVPVEGVSVSPKTLNLIVGGATKTLKVAFTPENATNKDVTWKSSNTAIATVSTSGVVEAVAEGDATITVTTADGSYTDTCAVTAEPSADAKAARDVMILINAIKRPITPESEPAIQKAEEEYKNLTSPQKRLVTNYDNLVAARNELDILKDQEAVDKVIALINAIGKPTKDSAAKIKEAEAAYAKLTPVQQALVTNHGVLTKARADFDIIIGVKDIAKASISAIPAQGFTGKALTPSFSVTLEGKALVQDKDYTVVYANNIELGTATLTITGKGGYKGTLTGTFHIVVIENKTYTVGVYKYKVTNVDITGNGTVTVTGVTNKKLRTIKVGNTVTIGGKKFKITAIGVSAFKNCKKATKATVGKNVITIGKNAFSGASKLGRINIKTIKLAKKIGKNAFKGIKAKARIQVPKKKYTAYKRYLSGRGQKSSVKIIK